MIVADLGGCVHGPCIAMSHYEAARIKSMLLAYGTKEALCMANEIGMPSQPHVHAGESARIEGTTYGKN